MFKISLSADNWHEIPEAEYEETLKSEEVQLWNGLNG